MWTCLKKNNSKWEDITKPKAGGFSSGGFSTGEMIKSEEISEYLYLGKQTMDGHTVDVYKEKITRNYERNIGLSINEEKIWVDEKGRYLKTETKSRIGDKHIFQMTVVYEYDPGIKITSPKIK